MLVRTIACQSYAYVSHTSSAQTNCDHWMIAVGLQSVAIIVILSYAICLRIIPPRNHSQEADNGT